MIVRPTVGNDPRGRRSYCDGPQTFGVHWETMPSISVRFGYRYFALSIFLSAFLLFAIQPIASKHLLPYFGGSSSVWATSLVFFTTILFLGYAYVYFVTSLRSALQVRIHGALIVAAMLVTLAAMLSWGSIYPPLDWITGSTLAPTLRVLLALGISVGMPYFLLSTTGPLLQYWYGVSSEREPYKLYALSNAGSLLALLAYPTLIEPNIALPSEELIWTILFFLYAILLTLVTVSIRNIPPHIRASAADVGTLALKGQWIGFAALPAFLLVATTTVITQLISPVPLLWIVPLAIYLLTFIFAFSGIGRTVYMPLFVLVASAAAFLYTPASPNEIVNQVLSYLSLLFFACLFCHSQLYRLRPRTEALPFFYLCTSLGGMLGTMCASLLPPLIFDGFFEFPLGLAITASLAVVLLPSDFYPRIVKDRTIRAIRIIAPFFFAVMLTNVVIADVSPDVRPSRNFYGAVQLHFNADATVLMHGTTMHGLQPTEKEWSYVPTSYYTQGSGIGRALRYVREKNDGGPISVGVLGLGTGSIAAYCEKNDTFSFYEIDPDIEYIARNYFSYLSRCKGSSVQIGDGRLVLEKQDTKYDLFVADAFSDDAIPAHLMTREAVGIYFDHLKDERGIVAIHTSNRYLALYPVLLSIARSHGLTAMIVSHGTGEDEDDLSASSQWVLLAKDPKVFDDPAFIGVERWFAPDPLPRPWTDTYTSLFSVFDVPLPF